MPEIIVKFKNHNPLRLQIDNTNTGIRYFNLVKENYTNTQPIYRDRVKYTKNYLLDLAKEAKEAFGWNWTAESYNISNTALLHKDLEELLGTVGFDNVLEKYDNLLHELHYCLHIVQHPHGNPRGGWLQVEWFNDEGFDLPYEFEFKDHLEIGDVKLQNPFVGHGPMQMWDEQDFTKISQTCKFHTFVKPGINIVTQQFPTIQNYADIIATFKKHDPAFVALHGEDKIRHYTGYPVIGRVLNLDDLEKLIQDTSVLEFEKLEFYEFPNTSGV